MRVCSFCQRCFDDAVFSCSEDAHPPLSETRNGSTEMVTGYRLESLQSGGLSGDVYRARQIASGRSCMITLRSVDRNGSDQFLKEASLAASLFHPNLADVYEAGSLATGECFVVSEDPMDETMRDRLQTAGAPKLLDAIGLIRQTAEALHEVHLKGLIHRALRPENIIISSDADGRSQVRVQNIDFAGVSERAIMSNKFLIDTAIDSLRYFSPEQCSGEAVGPKTDVYSLGIILYEMLAGKPPFDAGTAAGVVEKHRNHRAPDIRIDNFELRMLITHTLMESLHKRPDKRQATANAFARQLRHVEQLATHVSTPPPAGTVRIPPRDADRTAAFATPTAPPSPEIDVSKIPALHSVHAVDSFKNLQPDVEPEPRIAGPSVIEDLGAKIANFVRETSAPAISHFSRLKQRRKKQHPRASKPEIEPETKSAPEKPGLKTFSAEAAAVRLASELKAVADMRSKAEPRKVEWSLSEDDIPVLKDPDVTRRTELPIETADGYELPEVPSAVKPAEVSTLVRKKASKIERKQPDGDIPLLSDVKDIVIYEAAPETPIVQATHEIPIVQAAPNAVDEIYPTEEITTVVAPLPKRAEAQTVGETADALWEAEMPAAAPQQLAEAASAQEIRLASAMEPAAESTTEPSPVVGEPVVVFQPKEPAPQLEPKKTRAVGQTPKKAPTPVVDPNFATTFQLKPRGIRVSGLQSKPTTVPTLEDTEEITLVSPTRSRFRVPVNTPQPARKHTPARRVVPIPSPEAVFIPTLLGGTVKPATTEPAPTDSILTAYYPTPGARSVPYRSIGVGAGFLALIAFFLFAGDSVWNNSTATSGETVSANPPAARTLPATVPAVVTLPVKKTSFKAADRAVSKPTSDTGEDVSTLSQRPAPGGSGSKPASTTLPRAEVRSEPPRSVTRPDPPEPVTHQKPQPITVRSNGATRPRIVPE